MRFLKLIELENLAAHDISKTILDFYKHHDLPINHLVMLTSDGASVMVGRSKGVVCALQVSGFYQHFIFYPTSGYAIQIVSRLQTDAKDLIMNAVCLK